MPSKARRRAGKTPVLTSWIDQRHAGRHGRLRLPALDDYGLAAALRAHANRVSARAGIPIIITGKDDAPRPRTATETALFRIAQEALTNVLKHAGASRVDIH